MRTAMLIKTTMAEFRATSQVARSALLVIAATLAAGALFPASAPAEGDPFGDPRQLTYPSLRPIQVPQPTRTVLPNGMVVYLLEDHEFPVVDARALIRTGDLYEPAGKTGLASMTGEVMRSGGSLTMNGDSLDTVLEGLGASVEISIGETEGNASVSTLSEDFETGVRILADLLRHPAFPEEKIELARTRMMTGISARNDEMMGILFREFPKLLYGADHPWARHTEYATVDAITRADLAAFHGRFFHPDRIILTVYGDFQTKKVEALLRRTFGDWPKAAMPMPPDPPAPTPSREALFVANKADATNTGVLLGHAGFRMDDPDYPAMMLLNEVLGGGFSGRLVNEIRSRRGLAYSTGSSPGADWHHAGTFVAFAMTQADSSAATAGYIMDELRKVLDTPVTDEEITRAREGILNSLVFTLSSKGAVLNRLAQYEYYGYPPDFLQRYQDALRTLTPADLREAAQRRIRPAEMVTFLVGPRDKVVPALAALGRTPQEIDLTIPEPVEAGEAGGSESAFVPGAADFARGGELLRRASQATLPAGAAALRDFTWEETGTVYLMERSFDVGAKTVMVAPDCSWTEQQLPFGTSISARCGEANWLKSPRGLRELMDEERTQQSKDRERDLLRILREPSSLRAYALPGEVEIAGRPAFGIGVESELIRDWKLYVDREDGRIVRQEFKDRPPQGGAPVIIQIEYRDYRDVGGILLWPHLMQREVATKPFLRMETTAAAVNTGPDRAIFDRPAE